MTWTSLDRWTCPSCVSDAKLPAAIRAAQLEHAADHPAPREEPTRTTQLAGRTARSRR